ncbi:hypothetical protein BGZ57DRAFT_779392 [Hyaloscypha finlandica]|nr:hypothetical protein BGZ57DRAFT_779392 [Hyaloscypha finlandica]
MSFGYLVGDFIALAGLVHNVICKLKDAGGARSIYRELYTDLKSLHTTLHRVQSLEQEGRGVGGLRQACGTCLERIHEFLRILDKFQPTLRHKTLGGWVHELKTLVDKINFGVLKEEQVKDFRLSLANPLQSVQIELTALV